MKIDGDNRIREIRKSLGLTLDDVAQRVRELDPEERSATTASQIHKLETSKLALRLDWLELLARALNVQPMELVREQANQGVPLLGRILHGDEVEIAVEHPIYLRFNPPATMAVIVDVDGLDVERGRILLVDRAKQKPRECSHESIVELHGGRLVYRRVAEAHDDGTCTLLSLRSREIERAHVISCRRVIAVALPIFQNTDS